MCGIAGFVGRADALGVVLDTLTHLEYRGYDSAGVAFFEGGKVRTVKTAGRIATLRAKTRDVTAPCTSCIGHTRWATHGRPNDRNAHPHTAGRVTLVHNGIIENAASLKEELITKGYSFVSDTDTEVCAALIDYNYSRFSNPIEAIASSVDSLCGSYAICAFFGGHPDEIYAFRKDSPLAVAVSEEGCFAVSDIAALPPYGQSFVRLAEGDIVRINRDGIAFWDTTGANVHKDMQGFDGAVLRGDRGGYSHYMLKEIFDGVQGVAKTIEETLSTEIFGEGFFASVGEVHFVACGSAYNAAACAVYALHSLSDIPAQVHIASEFRYFCPKLKDNALIVLVSQSGETADTLAALRLAKSAGVRTLAVVNTMECAMSAEADYTLYTHAGVEVSVASTKAYSVQLAALYLVAAKLSLAGGSLGDEEYQELVRVLGEEVVPALGQSLAMDSECSALAQKLTGRESIFFVGRGPDYALSLEAALKVKEITYIHCEAYPSGELKHGSIALIDEGVPVVAFITCPHTADKVIANIREVKARGAYVAAFVADGLNVPDDICDTIIRIPKAHELFVPIVCAPLLQFTAYHMAVLCGTDPDRPRNLAKSVTVE